MSKATPSEIIKTAMKEKDWNAGKACAETGISASTWRRWLRGGVMLEDSIASLVEIFDLDEEQEQTLMEYSEAERIAASERSKKTISGMKSAAGEVRFEENYRPISAMRF